MSGSRKITQFYSSSGQKRQLTQQRFEDDRITTHNSTSKRPDPMSATSPRQALVELLKTSPRANAAPSSKRRRVDNNNASNGPRDGLSKSRTAPRPKHDSLAIRKSRSLQTPYIPAWKRLGLKLKHAEQTSTFPMWSASLAGARSISTAALEEAAANLDGPSGSDHSGEPSVVGLGLPPTPRSSPVRDGSVIACKDAVGEGRSLDSTRNSKPRPQLSKTSKKCASTQQDGPIASVEQNKHGVRRLLEVRIVTKQAQSSTTLADPVSASIPQKSLLGTHSRKSAAAIVDKDISDDEQLPTPEEEPSVQNHQTRRPQRSTKRVSYIEPALVIDSDSEPDRTVGFSAESDESDFEATDDAESVAESDDDVAATDAESDAVEDADEESGADEEKEQVVPTKKARSRPRTVNANPVKAGLGVDLSLPPLSSMEDIFADMASRALPLGLNEGLSDLSKHPFKIGTMCSGTESPLLATQGISEALKKMGLPGINFQHEFSAEIDVIKQSYIERNFRPKILFRDVREFIPEDAQSATTAYGANVPIPTVDMLVAGFVCKDLSQLNSHKKGLKDEGESGDTFAAIYSYARNFRPGIVLLENVVNTKELWNDLMLKWAAIGYECQWLYCDTKNYYLPHTRRRMYMIALEKSLFGKGVEQAAQKWKENMEQLRRQCSSPFEAFLVEDHSDQYSYNARTLESDWELCRLRYDRTRSNEQLGIKRPISQWSENGTVRPPDFANRKWYYSQSSRVWDAVDIAHLRAARSDHDSLHKMLAWDVSQNPDRFRTPIGVVGCITPNGCVFVTNRQTALNGSQMLRLQGIQSDKLLLGRESQSELQDLAGNAMSSTVIGTSIISAIITGRKTFRTHISPTEDDVTATIKNLKVQLLDVGSTNTQALSSEKLEGVDVTRLVEDARRSSPLCVCEGHKHVSKSVIHVCGDCKHTACANCSGNPRHNYANLLSREIRILPSDFEKTWRHQLPSRIRFTQFPDFRESITSGTTETWRAIVEQVQEADLHNQWFTMSSFQRDDREWIISYVAPLATLQLQIRESIEWRLYVKCRESEPGISPVRHRLQLPLARGPVTGNLLNPPWEVLFPNKDTYTLSIAGSKSRVASWRSRIGLPDYKSETLPFALDIQSHHQTSNLKAIYGHYTLLPNCGSAMSSLYQRKDEGKPPLYLFLESDPIGSGDKDRFTFSTDFRPLPYGQSRVFSAQLDPSWRPWTMATKVNVKTTVAGTWNTAPISMETDVGSPIQVKIPSPTAMAQYVPSDCLQAVKILDVKINEITHARTFSSYSWALERTRLLPAFNRWNKVVAATGTHSVCSCSPASPRVLWSVDTAGTATAREDQKAAASFERAIKTRRPVLEVHASAVTGGTQVQITMNIVTLVHRARARLPKFGTCDTAWSLDTNYVGKAWEPFEKFHLRSNADDLPYSGPLQLEWELTDAQKRSLAWMRTQEHGKTLQVVEIEEETNAELGWRAQARAQVEIIVRGGVLADLPSFGKTVTTIGLIQSEFEENGPATIIKNNTRSCKQQSNLIEVAATLIVCPKHITKQWRDELESFLGDRQFEEYNTLVIENYQQLGKLSIADMCKARVIIVSWQLVADDNYISELARFAAMPEPTSTHGRAFDAWLDYVDDQMSNRIETLRTTDASSFEEEMVETLQKRLESERFKAVVPLKIRHGSSYKSYSSMSLSAEQTSTPGAEAFPIQKVAKSNGNDDWSSRLCPLLQKFKFNRVVVDEYHYLLEKGPRDKPFKNQTAYAIIKRLHGHKKWILSGTPALASFSDVNQIASLLGGTLGRDVFEAKSRAIEHERRSLADQTEVERFISNIETMTYEWHQGRHCRAKEFLDAFVRQNAPALDHIPCTERLLPIELSDAHRCVYLEQSQHLIAQRMQIKKARQTKADRYDRLNTSLNNSDTAEEALLRSALCFKSMGEGAGLDGLIQKRRDQIEATTRDIQDCLLEAERYEKLSKDKDNHYSGYKRAIKSTNVLGDEDACRVIRRLITAVEQQGINSRNAIKPAKCAEQLKTITSTITSYAQELTLRQRSFRFIEAVQGLLPTISASDNAQTPRCDSPQCEGTASDLSQLFLISHCGHLACEPCLTTRADNECCVHDGCSAPALPSNMINVPELGSTRDGSAGASHGEKLATICRLIQSVSDDDQAIVFVPNEYDIDIVTEALEEHDISHHAVSKSRRDAADIIDDFQKNSDPEERKRVLVLNLGDESAAGVNLVNANHVIFVAPLLAEDQYTYESSMAQAIARCRRYRQEKRVYIYHFAALRTIDVDILEHRHKRIDGVSSRKMPRTPNRRGGKKEKTKMVRVSEGDVSLIPRSWLTDKTFCKCLGIDPNAQEKFTSLINFSENFKDDDE